MVKPQTLAKRKWNKEHYTNVTVAMNPEMAAILKSRCADEGVSVTSVIIELVKRYLDYVMPADAVKPAKETPSNRGRRKKELQKHVEGIIAILEGEQDYLDNITENLQGSVRYENAENSVNRLEAAIEELEEVYPKGG